MPPPERLLVALLAAGRSRRFGAADKLVAPLAGRPLLHWAAEAGHGQNAAQHVVVTAPDCPQQILPQGYAHLVNGEAETGLSASLRLAAQHARTMEADALLVLLGDMPLVTAAHLGRLVAAFDPARPVFSRPPGGPAQPPALFPAALFPALETRLGDSGARGLSADALLVEAPAAMLMDVDIPADLARCEQALEKPLFP